MVKWFDEQLEEPIKLYREKVMANKEPPIYIQKRCCEHTHICTTHPT